MNKIRLVQAIIKENQEFNKICFYYNGHYYDLVTLNRYEVFNGKSRVVAATILNENLLDDNIKASLERRKNDLLRRLSSKHNLEYVTALEDDVFADDEVMSMVLYKVSKIVMEDGKYRLNNLENLKLGIMINDLVYDVNTGNLVKTLDNDLNINDEFLRYVKVIPKELLNINEYMSLILLGNEIINGKCKSKVIVMDKMRGYSNN